MIIHITNVKVVDAYSLELTFDNGVEKRVNLRSELYSPIFEPLRDPSLFAKAFIDTDSRTVTWPNGADFAPVFCINWNLRKCRLHLSRILPRS
jgi:hypothetical protein